DFGWWSGLNLGEARTATELAAPALAAEELDGEMYWQRAGRRTDAAPDGAHLLPAFDEYTVAYKNRATWFNSPLTHIELLDPVMACDARRAGLWRRVTARESVKIELAPFGKISPRDRERFHAVAQRYAGFLGLPAEITHASVADLRRPRRR